MEPRLKNRIVQELLKFFQDAHLIKDIRTIPYIAEGIEDKDFTIEDVREIYDDLNRAVEGRPALLKKRGHKNGSVYMIDKVGKEWMQSEQGQAWLNQRGIRVDLGED